LLAAAVVVVGEEEVVEPEVIVAQCLVSLLVVEHPQNQD
jgi:hypothetical protein